MRKRQPGVRRPVLNEMIDFLVSGPLVLNEMVDFFVSAPPGLNEIVAFFVTTSLQIDAQP